MTSPRNQTAVHRLAASGLALMALLAVSPAHALAPEVTQAIALYEAVMADPVRLASTCANLRKLSELQRGGTVTVVPPADAVASGSASAPGDPPDVDGNGWQGAEQEQKASRQRRQAGSGFIGKSALIASDPVLSASAALQGVVTPDSEDALAMRAVAARLFDKCTM